MQPIRDLDQLNGIKQHLRETNKQQYLLFLFGIYTGLQMLDILFLTVGDIQGTHIEVREYGTGKLQRVIIHQELRKALDEYVSGRSDDERLFEKDADKELVQSLTSAADRVGLQGEVGAETLRKTWGYQLYRQAEADDQMPLLAAISSFYSHKSTLETIEYLQIVTQEDIDRAMTDFEL